LYFGKILMAKPTAIDERELKSLQIERDENGEDLKSKENQSRVDYILLAILGIALFLRVWGIGIGLPYDFNYDELHEILRAMKLGAGEYDWSGFGKGGLYFLLFIEYCFLYLVWSLTGLVTNPSEFALLFIQDSTPFYLIGRLTVALLGTLTCLVIYLIGRQIYNRRVALGAAFIGATAYYHGMWSHLINVDVGMTLALWTSILFYIGYEKRMEFKWLLGSGALGGIAIAFKLPGAIVLLALPLAIASRRLKVKYLRSKSKDIAIVILTIFLTLTVFAPEWILSIGSIMEHFPQLSEKSAVLNCPKEGEIIDAINWFHQDRGKQGTGYFTVLFNHRILLLTITAMLGAIFGLRHRNRWDIVWVIVFAVFIGIMSLAARAHSERYLMPIMPVLWLQSSRGINIISGRRIWANATAVVCVSILPLAYLVQQDIMWTKPDTRVLAKEWIESNIPSGAKILMDGMRYRFVQSPPLNPDNSTVARRVVQAKMAKRLSRGISKSTLAIYARAMEHKTGPTYELHSTVWGLEVHDLNYYIHNCYDYLITSSFVSELYTDSPCPQSFQKTFSFYDQLKTDPRVHLLYSLEPVSWISSGPTLKVYEIMSSCNATRQEPVGSF
jgi:4-amino-4-deoxy-L-arabinose transferase-like glycosyltransferase